MRVSRRSLLKGTAALLVGACLPGPLEAYRHGLPLAQADRKRIYLAPDDHTDYLWTAGEDDYRQAFLEMVDYYLDLADATQGNPTEYQSRWNCDGSFWMWTYERHKPLADFERLIERIRSGHISVPLNALCVCLGGAPAEAVLRGMYYPGQIERRYNLRFALASMIENATQPYGLVSLWAGSGAKYSWKGVCGCDSQVPYATLSDRDQEIYWWTGPDGSRILTKWYSLVSDRSVGGYAEAYDPAAIVELVDTNSGFIARYPYRVIGAFGQGWDNLKTTDQRCVEAAQSKSNATRSVIVSNEQDFFEDFEATYGTGLPSLACSFGNEWELYCAALAEVSARVKRTVEKLRAAEALATLVSMQDASFMDGRQAARDQAWMDLGLFWEHNLGMYGYPGDSPMVSDRIEWQRRLATEIETYVDALFTDAATALGGMVLKSGSELRFYAFNPLSWARTDVADVPYPGATPVHVIDLATGQETPSQLVTVGGEQKLRVLAQDVPSVGYKVFEVRAGSGQEFPDGPNADAGTGVMHSALYQVTVAPRGAITGLVDKARGDRQFAKELGGYYINDLGPSSGTLAVENAGPVSVTLRATAALPLAHTTRITLFRSEINRIEVQNDINENFDASPAWRFGFNLTSPDLWHEEVGAVTRAKLLGEGGHYSPRNARYDWITLNHFADMSGSDGVGVTLSNADCYFMQLGNSTATSLDTDTPQLSALAGGRVANGDNGLPSQGGDTRFLQRFALKTHSDYDQPAAMKFALEHQNRLVTGVVAGGTSYPENSYSLLTISDPSVLLWALKPADDGIEQGIIVRLWNLSPNEADCSLVLASGPIVQATRVTHIETPIETAPLSEGTLVASLNAQQLKTWAIVPPETGWSPPPAPTGVLASDGAFAYQVRVAWDPVPAATGYEVWRHTSNEPGSALRIVSGVTTTGFSDISAVSEQVYFYWVKATNPYAASDFSAPDTGWKRLPLPTDAFVYLPLITK